MTVYILIGIAVFLLAWNRFAYFCANFEGPPGGQKSYVNRGRGPTFRDYLLQLIWLVPIVLLWPISLFVAFFMIKIKPPQYLGDGSLNPLYDKKSKK